MVKGERHHRVLNPRLRVRVEALWKGLGMLVRDNLITMPSVHTNHHDIMVHLCYAMLCFAVGHNKVVRSSRMTTALYCTYLEVPGRELVEVSLKVCHVQTPCLILGDLNDVSATLSPRQEVRVMLKWSDEDHGPFGTSA